jgi:hypothetical protein
MNMPSDMMTKPIHVCTEASGMASLFIWKNVHAAARVHQGRSMDMTRQGTNMAEVRSYRNEEYR